MAYHRPIKKFVVIMAVKKVTRGVAVCIKCLDHNLSPHYTLDCDYGTPHRRNALSEIISSYCHLRRDRFNFLSDHAERICVQKNMRCCCDTNALVQFLLLSGACASVACDDTRPKSSTGIYSYMDRHKVIRLAGKRCASSGAVTT